MTIKGGGGLASTQVFAGNTPPEVQIETSSNRSFYWDNSLLDYNVTGQGQGRNSDQSGKDQTYFWLSAPWKRCGRYF
jgi:hypothetical protein